MASGGHVQTHLTKQGMSYQVLSIENKTRETREKTGRPSRSGTNDFDEILHTYRVDLRWLGSTSNYSVEFEERLPGLFHFYNAPAGGQPVTHLPAYKKIILKNLWEGVNLNLLARNGQVEVEWRVAEGSLHSQIGFEVIGAYPVAEGAYLNLVTPLGILREGPLKTFQEGRALDCRWVVEGQKVYIQVNDYDTNKPLLIDPPVVAWGTYYGAISHGWACTADPAGHVILAGQSFSQLFIATSGAHQSTFGGGSYDGFLAKFDNQGQRLWATFYGGEGSESVEDVTCDGAGNIYVCGMTSSSSGIATSGSHQTQLGGLPGDEDAFLVRFAPDGTRLWGTYYGGNGSDWGWSCVASAPGTVYMVGRTGSDTGIAAPTGAFRAYRRGVLDAFAVAFNFSGNRIWGTYFGGSGLDEAYDCALDAMGNLLMCGYSQPSDTTVAFGGHQSNYGGGVMDGFLAKFNSNGMFQWSTYCGGEDQDDALGVGTDLDNNVYVVGSTMSQNSIGTPGTHQTFLTNPSAGSDGYIMKFDSFGALLWGTYYGATSSDLARSVAVGPQNRPYVFGETYSSTGFSTPGAVQPSPGGLMDAFIAIFNTDGSLEWGTYFGGDEMEYEVDGWVSTGGTIYLSGTTSSSNNIASGNGHQLALLGSSNAFLVKICDGVPAFWDGDGDGFGDPSFLVYVCESTPGFVPDSGDCDDASSVVFPGAPETCNEVDDNCNGLVDEGVVQPFYPDMDGDGFGNASAANNPLVACSPPPGYVSNFLDCQDSNPAVFPGATEVCNNIDDNCNSLTDDDDPSVVGQLQWYWDGDGDGFGHPDSVFVACDSLPGFVADPSDCNDTDAAIYPGAVEVCNGVDDNCNGTVDEGCVGLPETPEGFQISAFPVPFHQDCQVVGTLPIPSGSPLHFKVFDAAGRLVEAHIIPAAPQINLRLGLEWSSGMYYLLIMHQGRYATIQPLIKLP
ncbi:MAG: MopE-related protein [Flavobacteriales bacterium]|nr:MopE-related protein [Flavobacteriales bacterium]MCX7650737.1 MopE-related protein [Flavobacteriales bacterium]MDW8432662.1 MopE-related protein [Flavobacteriales bacterium]